MIAVDRAAILDALLEFYSEKEARVWLETPQSLLGGATANDYIERGYGRRVLAIIDALRTGAFL